MNLTALRFGGTLVKQINAVNNEQTGNRSLSPDDIAALQEKFDDPDLIHQVFPMSDGTDFVVLSSKNPDDRIADKKLKEFDKEAGPEIDNAPISRLYRGL